MTIKIPDNYMGKPIKGSLEKALASTPAQSPQTSSIVTPVHISVNANINPSDYIQIDGTNVVIRKEEIFKGKNWNDTHYALADEGLFMPRIDIFMQHFMNLRDASRGIKTLYDAANNKIKLEEAQDLWKYLSTNHRNGCYTWLDSFFKRDANKDIIVTNHKVYNNGANKEIKGQEFDLETFVGNIDGLVNLNFNAQGLPKTCSPHSGYVQGDNIYFYYPRNENVAGFVAGSDGADLYCDGDPSNADSSLGVFACAEGAATQK